MTKKEMLIAGLLSAAILIGAFVVINPAARAAAAQDEQKRQNIEVVINALEQYRDQSESGLPTYDGGRSLPTVTLDTVVADGVNLNLVDDIEGEYINAFPQATDQNDYKIGVLSGGSIAVGILLSNGETYSQQLE